MDFAKCRVVFFFDHLGHVQMNMDMQYVVPQTHLQRHIMHMHLFPMLLLCSMEEKGEGVWSQEILAQDVPLPLDPWEINVPLIWTHP